jgi:hypothetical protein
MAYGTIATLDSLRSNFQTIAEFGGVARIQDSLQVFFESHNNRMREFMADFMDRTVERDMIYGTNDTMKMVRTDEFGRPDPQKITYGAVVGFPLHSYQASIQWTEKSVETLPVAEFTAQYLALRAADIERVTREAQRALFNPTNYVFTDYLMDRRSQVPIQVRALANADGNPLPVGPNGDAFPAATHTHYLATAAFVVGDLTATVETVVEHYNTGSPFVYINRAQETVVRSFAGFVAYPYPGVVPYGTPTFPGRQIDPIQLTNRSIGVFNGAEVWVKPWVPAGYVIAFMRGVNKPLMMRTRNAGSGDFRMAARESKFPLSVETWEREFGVGVYERTSASVLFTGGASYTAPVLEE